MISNNRLRQKPRRMKRKAADEVVKSNEKSENSIDEKSVKFNEMIYSNTDDKINSFGFGTLPLGVEYPDPFGRPSREEAIKLLHVAITYGVQIFDTADSYFVGPHGDNFDGSRNMHYTEHLLAEGLATYSGPSDLSKILVVTKIGLTRINNDSSGWRPRRNMNTSEQFHAAILESCQVFTNALVSAKESKNFDAKENPSLKLPYKLCVMLHHTHEIGDLRKPLIALNQAKEEGHISHIGLSNCSVKDLKTAKLMNVQIDIVENEFSLYHRTPEKEYDDKAKAAKHSYKGVLQYTKDHNILFMCYGVCGGTQARGGKRNLARDFPALKQMADEKGCSIHAMILAYIRRKYDHVAVITGCRTMDHLLDSTVHASDMVPLLTQADVECIDNSKPRK